MKKIVLTLLCILILSGCGGKTNNENKGSITESTVDSTLKNDLKNDEQ